MPSQTQERAEFEMEVGAQQEEVGGQQEEEEEEEDDKNISSDSSSDGNNSNNNSSHGMRSRPRKQAEAKEGPKEVTEERRKQLAAAGKIGAEKSASSRSRPFFIRVETSGRFVSDTITQIRGHRP
ncbi:hypothetical protein VYU27_000249 [Nannochloropsis oceanica]